MIYGELCFLRPVEIDDCETIRDWRMSDHVAKNFPSSEPISLHQQKEWLMSVSQDKNCQYFVICEKIENKPVGLIFLINIDRVNQNAEFGYYLGDINYHGTGVAIEAELMILNFAFSEQNMHKVFCESMAYNEKVLSIHSQFGFEKEGIKREHIYKEGIWNNLVLMSVLKDEFHYSREKISTILQNFTDR